MAARSEDAYDRVAIVTGADSGIGRATAVALAGSGFDVGVTYSRDADGAEATAEEVRGAGVRAEVRHVDLSDPGAAADALDGLADALGGIGVLVNAAGSGTDSPILELDLATWRDVLAVDLDGAFTCSQRMARRMVAARRGGRIVNVTSVHEHQPRVGSAAYSSAKAGLGMLTKSLALELAEHRITVNSVAPGEISTPMTGQTDVDPHSEQRPGVPLGRPGDAREVAAVIAFLAGPDASYVTGASFVVDGGMLLTAPQHAGSVQSDEWRKG